MTRGFIEIPAQTAKRRRSLRHNARVKTSTSCASVREQLEHAVLHDYFLTAWNLVVAKVCGGRCDDPVVTFVHPHLDKNQPMEAFCFQGDLGSGGTLRTRSDLSCYVECHPEDRNVKRDAMVYEANLLLRSLHRSRIEAELMANGQAV